MKPTVIPAIFKAKDEMSSTIARMQQRVGKFAKNFTEKFERAGQSAFKLGRQMAIVGGIIAAPLILSAKAAIEF